MPAADSEGIGICQISARKDAGGRGASADVNDRRAEFGLVIDQSGQAGSIGRRDHCFDCKMAAFDGEHQIA